MAENIPPGSATKSGATADVRGLPFYEKLRRDLRDTLQKKRALDKSMALIEDQIYRQETAYLEDTSAAGNIIKGFDNYIKSSTITATSAGGGTISGSAAGGGPTAGRRKTAINDSDRVFSRSSVAFTRDSDSPSSAQSTPVHAGTPTGSFASGTEKNDKKKKKVFVAEESETDGRANKRQKITFGPRKSTHED